MIIDGHAHACGGYLTSDSIVRLLDENGVSRVVLVPGEPDSDRTYNLPDFSRLLPGNCAVKFTNILTKIVISLKGTAKHIEAGNEHVYSLVRANPDRVIQFYWVTRYMRDVGKTLDERLRKWGFKGIKLHQCWESFSIDSDHFRTAAAWAEGNDLPLFVHLFSIREVGKLVGYKTDHPNLKLILGHLFGLEYLIRHGRRLENVYFDISSYQFTSNKRVMKCLREFGSERILFGTDTPYGKDNLKGNIDRLNNLPITDRDRKNILGENLRKLLRL